MGWYTAEIDIHCGWSISYPAFCFILKVGWASGIIFEPLIVHMVPFLSKSTLKLHANCQIWCALSAQEMGCCATRRDIHCCWSVSKPLLDVNVRRVKFVEASNSLLYVMLCHVNLLMLIKWLINCNACRINVFLLKICYYSWALNIDPLNSLNSISACDYIEKIVWSEQWPLSFLFYKSNHINKR